MIHLSACQPQADQFPALSGRHGQRRSYTTQWDTICAGPVHTKGMSWTTSLDKAIYYAKWHADFHLEPGQSAGMAVYATTVDLREVYCRLDRNEDEFIVVPVNLWRFNVPAAEFRLDRPRH